MKFSFLFFAVALMLGHDSRAQHASTLYFDDLPLQTYSEGIRPVSTKSNYWKNTIKIQGISFSRGFGAQSPSVLSFMLDGNATRFLAEVGVDDSSNTAIPLTFYVLADQKILFQSKPLNVGDAPVKIDVDLTGVRQLGLLITDTVGGLGNKRTNGNWANARLSIKEGFTPGYVQNNDPKYILTPEPKKTPQINTARVFGATPGNPVLFKVATTGQRPIRFSAVNLPTGLKISPETGIITGAVTHPGNYEVMLKAKNQLGEATKKLIFKIGDTIALTPPIGWNGWNSWEAKIDQDKVLASANAMVKTGLADHGWTYINVDDAWMGKRGGPDTALQPNEKFPDIKGMIDQVHAMGLKAGLYSTPYIASYGGYVGASSDYPTGGETHELFIPNRPPYSRIGKY